jgi:hypothetical protein
MGELKQLSESQQNLVERVKSLGQQVYLANLGLATKVEENSKKQYDRLVTAGTESRGQQAAETNKAVLAAVGLVEVLKTEAEKLKGDGFKQQVETLKQRFSGFDLKAESQRLFDELVATGEKRNLA